MPLNSERASGRPWMSFRHKPIAPGGNGVRLAASRGLCENQLAELVAGALKCSATTICDDAIPDFVPDGKG